MTKIHFFLLLGLFWLKFLSSTTTKRNFEKFKSLKIKKINMKFISIFFFIIKFPSPIKRMKRLNSHLIYKYIGNRLKRERSILLVNTNLLDDMLLTNGLPILSIYYYITILLYFITNPMTTIASGICLSSSHKSRIW